MRRATSTPVYHSSSVELLKQALADKGMRQQELAQKTGLSKDHISRILLGKVPFPKSRDTITVLARALDLDPLLFTEYRRQLQVLPESTRRLCAHLKQKGITQQEFIKRIPHYSEGHLQLILRGGSPFPKDPETIEVFAKAAEASPYLFPEYLPLAEWQQRVATAAGMALDKADVGVFMHLWGKIERYFEQMDAGEQSFDERLLQHFLLRAFGEGAGANGANGATDPELDDALSYLPPLSSYQPEVQAVLAAMYERKLTVEALATAIGGDQDTLFAILKGQMKLKDGPVKHKLFKLLDLGAGDNPAVS